MPTWGWDASDFDWARGPMDVAAAARDGIVFFTHKATEGTKIWHRHYGEALNRARAAGMPVMGAYMVPRTPGNNGHGPIDYQVQNFLTYLDAQTPWWRDAPEFFLQVDTEHWGYDDVAPQYGADACAQLRAQTGKWVIHYAPRWAYGDTIPGDDPLWASSYGTNPAVPYRQAYPGDDSDAWAAYSGRVPTFLQYGSQLTIGSQPSCDANAFRGTLDQLRALITGGDDMSWEQDIAIDPIPGVPAGQPGGPNNPDGKEHHEAGEWLAYGTRDAYMAVQATARIEAALAKLALAQGQTLTAEQLTALGNTIAATLVASNANGLTAADHDAIVADVKRALREGVGAAAQG